MTDISKLMDKKMAVRLQDERYISGSGIYRSTSQPVSIPRIPPISPKSISGGISPVLGLLATDLARQSIPDVYKGIKTVGSKVGKMFKKLFGGGSSSDIPEQDYHYKKYMKKIKKINGSGLTEELVSKLPLLFQNEDIMKVLDGKKKVHSFLNRIIKELKKL